MYVETMQNINLKLIIAALMLQQNNYINHICENDPALKY